MSTMTEDAYWRNMAEVSKCLSANLINQAQLVDAIAKGLADRAAAGKAVDPCETCGIAPWVRAWDKPCEHRETCVAFEQWEEGQ